MATLLLVVFILQLIIHLVNTIGATAINELLWNIYNYLPISKTSNSASKQKSLRREVLRLRKELNATSSQDEFAKWAKLRRQHDKALEELEKTTSTLTTSKTKFTATVSSLRWIGTNGLRFLLQFWYTKQAMFYLPKGWMPYYAEWLLSFPRAPMGSISIQAWCLACAAAILLVSDALGAGVGLVIGVGGTKVKGKEVPVMGAGGMEKEKEREGEKKEL